MGLFYVISHKSRWLQGLFTHTHVITVPKKHLSLPLIVVLKSRLTPTSNLGEQMLPMIFLKKFPLGKVPAFEGSDGTCLSESNAIAYYVADETLRGTNPIDKALVLQYVEFAENEILPSACTWVYPTLGFKQYNKQETDKAQAHLKKCMTMLNGFLETRTFLVGERITLADIAMACNMLMLYAQVLDPKFREPFGNVNRWFMTCINQPNFKSVLGDFSLCEKMAVFDNKRYQELDPLNNKDDKCIIEPIWDWEGPYL